MVVFPPQITFPNDNKIVLDKTRLLLGVKSPSTTNPMAAKLLSTAFKLEDPDSPPEPINHIKTRFWIRKLGEYNDDDLIVLKNEFDQVLDWLGPVYSNPDVPGRRGLMCPLPNVLIITLTSQASGNEQQISQNLDNNFTMKRSPEKSNYSGLNTHYYVIQDTQNFDAYQVKGNLEPDTGTFKSFRFELMPLIVPQSMIPNDLQFNNQWNMTRIKAGGVGTTAWDLTTGNEDVVICVIDSGCDLAHPDLVPFASSGINLDTMSGNGTAVEPPGPGKLIGHGTAVAGIIAAHINNLLVTAGVAGKCKILPLAQVAWSTEELIRGINAAVAFKAKIINMSLNNNDADTTAIEDALEIASKNALICASTGNENKSTISYPVRSKYVMACGASDTVDNRQSPTSPTLWTAPLVGSNFGPEMSVVAPGIGIPTTDIVGPGGFGPADFIPDFQGTSAAVPHLSGLAGLILSVFPDISPDEARYIIERTADKVGILPYATDPGHPKWYMEYGNGLWSN